MTYLGPRASRPPGARSAPRLLAGPARIAINGVHYAVRRWGAGPPLVLLHGFTGSSLLWESHAAAFAACFDTIAVDLLGHGSSAAPDDPARYGMAQTVADLAAVLDSLRLERTALLGYSMGGRAALALAIEQPARVSALVLEGASPGIADGAERAARVAADAALARRIERDGVAAFVDAWLAQPLFASQARLDPRTRAAARAQRLTNCAAGLAASLRGCGSGAQPSYWHRLHTLAVPTLLLAGAHDAKFQALARAMQERIPDATLRIIADAGHATHLEQPRAFQGAVLSFLSPAIAFAATAARTGTAALPGPSTTED